MFFFLEARAMQWRPRAPVIASLTNWTIAAFQCEHMIQFVEGYGEVDSGLSPV
jgi:hypothetical protein